MGHGHDDTIINSEQEDLVGSSSSELDDGDEEEDDDELSDSIDNERNGEQRFNLCKTNGDGGTLSLIDSATDWNSSTVDEYQNVQQKQQAQLQHFRKCRRTFLLLIVLGLGLLFTSFSLFIILPLYQKQLEISRKGNNAYGSILFISPIITLVLIILANLMSWAFKWTTQTYKFPMPVKKLLIISLCCGAAGTLCTVSSYKRVPCHLQDPLKGAALVYSLVFYFFFCKKVMGLQKIFSATTAVVGLFISIDYGLCDEFRCHGNDTSGQDKPQSVGWQARAFWTLLYVTGIMLWTLQLSLIEGNLVMLSITPQSPPPTNLLTTISRLVSNSDRPCEIQPPIERSKLPKHRPKPIHIAAWIHIISLLTLLIFGIIDIIPGAGQVTSFSQHWIDAGNTFICHLGIEPDEFHIKQKTRAHETLEYLSNLTPGSILYNKTVQKLRRNKRDLETHHYKYFHHRLGHHYFDPEHHHNSTGNNHSSHAFKKYKNYTSTQTPLISRLILNSGNDTNGADCYHLSTYSWILIIIYIGFVLCVFHFLDISESAVFTISMITSALPFMGLFWSSFRLDTNMNTASLIWAPSISGELICSLLGTPIVFLGIILFYRAHFSDLLRPPCKTSSVISSSSNPYTSLRNA